MEKLIELTRVITKNKTKSISIIGNGMDNGTKLMQFYEGISSGKVINDDDAFRLLYPGQEDRNAYYKLKHQLKERLRNTLFFLDTKQRKFSNTRRALVECQRLVNLFNILYSFGARNNAIYYGHKALKIAEKYQFTPEIIRLARALSGYYAVTGDMSKLDQLLNLVEANTKLFIKETYADIYWRKITSLYTNDRSTKEYLSEQADKYLKELEQYDTPKLSLYLEYCINMLSISKYFTINDYNTAYKYCKIGIERMTSYEYLNVGALFGIAINYLACCIPLKKVEESKEVSKELLKHLEEGEFNWFKLHEILFIIAVHSRSFVEANQIFEKIRYHRKFNTSAPTNQEIWHIFEVWIYLLRETDWLEKELDEKKRKKFKIQKYLNEVPLFSKDKRGQNIPILVTHILLLLQQKKYNKLLDRFEAVNKYRDRYIKKDHNYRSNIFIRLLMEIPKANFRRKQVEKNATELLEKLKEMPIDVASQRPDQEIMPYDMTWELVLELLD